ncbi:Glyoxal reductase [Anaerobiospirillum thomasii]|uniref:Glyoxal reductase n=1 Tax=Anaerobiospirillum thomasii TaxID=179995 RepID=A0A2X0VTC8_9GAMM|nr:aldo/keto reductase [Anaerobiospirillum thomasii]SPT68454.1 Glyoxal reductase [Anaerobiospirillum thomasii]SPT70960.1 Glyoxal reductase [Anaerobiospirillum thomasii]
MQKLTDTFTLTSGQTIPCVGFGTWQTPDGPTAVHAVRAALDAGYRHIDTAAIYGNESSVGKAIKESGIAREEIFVTTKLWNSHRGYKSTKEAFRKSLGDLGLDYIDLYLIHWPASKSRFDNADELNIQSWQAMCELYEKGMIKSIGVSNFHEHHLRPLLEYDIKPMVNQIEFHPGFMQQDVVRFCKEHNILIEAWGPMGTGQLLENEILKEIAAKYDKSVAQICIRWCLECGTVPLPKSVNTDRIRSNAQVFDFSLTREDKMIIDNMLYSGGSGLHPDKVDF